jgi:glycosyltransferase involved in cell wall biosynthesis
MKTIAFVTRVHPQRPKMLAVCIESVKSQTDEDYIHIIHRDDKTPTGYGGLLANQSFMKIKSIDAQYVMVLDDDDQLIEPRFVEIFKKKIEGRTPEIVFFKGITAGFGTLPRPERWGRTPLYTEIASFCFAIRTDIWRKYIHEFGRQRFGGDFSFIARCYSKTKDHMWLDLVVAKMQSVAGRGRPENHLIQGAADGR